MSPTNQQLLLPNEEETKVLKAKPLVGLQPRGKPRVTKSKLVMSFSPLKRKC